MDTSRFPVETVSWNDAVEFCRSLSTLPAERSAGREYRLPTDRREVPAYVGHMDVNTMCYRIAGEGWWKGIYPLKLHEYLATGLPVVSTPVESVLPFGHVLNIAESVDGWLNTIADALSREDSEQQEMRCTVAMANSWDARVDLLEKWLSSL